MALDFFVETALWGLFLTTILFITFRKMKRHTMTTEEKYSFAWFLFNGILIHIFMDGIVGAAGFYEPLAVKYHRVDIRY
jgi:hypothetical protein